MACMNVAQPPSPTPEQIEILLQLQQIFMPQAQRQRDEAYRRQAKAGEGEPQELRFVHYTSAEAALSIIKSKRLWMRNAVCMSDYREVQHGFDILNKFFSEPAKMEAFVKAVDVCVPGAAKAAIDLFNQWWLDIRFNTFITSVSEHDNSEDFHGRLSMWRAFGLNTARVAIVFAVPKMSLGAFALSLLFNPVTYLPEAAVYAVIHEVMDNLAPHQQFLGSIDRQLVIGAIFDMLLVGVTCLKHEGFQEEREWRAIYCPRFNRSPLMESTIEVVGGVPQPVYRLPLDVSVSSALVDLDFPRMFNRLIIGPSAYPWAMFEAFGEALTQAGVADARERIWTSNIPIRTA
jgi:hypothetical protein